MQHRLNQPNVISESLDGEVVIIDLGRGTYYSLRGPGARAWDGLAAGWDLQDVEADLRAAFRSEGVDVAGELRAFIDQLVAEGLLLPGAPEAPLPPPAPADPPAAWAPFSLDTYTDMQELILLDPVHEVQPDRGWPVPLDRDPS